MELSTSILSCNDRINAVKKLNSSLVNYIHIDVMDGKFVHNTQFNHIDEVDEIQSISRYPLDIHLMVEDPLLYVKKYLNMNIKYITFHIEVGGDRKKIIDEIKQSGFLVGLAIKLDTDLEELFPYLDDIDMILIMSVEPGLGGQKFIIDTIDRVHAIKKMIGGRDVVLAVDGGITPDNIQFLEDADLVVVGSYITSSNRYDDRINQLFRSVNHSDN